MSVTYINRKKRLYYLCQGTTKTGKPRYYFATEPKGSLVDTIPPGFSIQESVNGIVSLSKVQPNQLDETDINAVKVALQVHPKSQQYRMNVKSKQITIYEHVGPNLMDLASQLTAILNHISANDFLEHLREEEANYGQFTPVMRFILTDKVRHYFKAQRISYLGTVDRWIDIGYDESLANLAARLVPNLGSDTFFELI